MRSKIESLKSEALPFLFENYQHLYPTKNSIRNFRVKIKTLTELLKTDPDTIITMVNSLHKDGFIQSVMVGRTAKDPVPAGHTSFTTSNDSVTLTEPAYLLKLDGNRLEKAILANDAAKNLDMVVYDAQIKTLSYGTLRPLEFHKLPGHQIENPRTKFMSLYWEKRLERRGGIAIITGHPVLAQTVAVSLVMVNNPTFYLKKGKNPYKIKLNNFVKNFNNDLKKKGFPMHIAKRGGIQIVIDYP